MNRQLFFLGFLALVLNGARGQKTIATPPKKPIICLTYDDALETQRLTVLPQLDSARLKGTFFLNSIQGSSLNVQIGHTPEAVLAWTLAATNGHELANHTLFHACPEKVGWDKRLAIEQYTVSRIITEITTQNTLLSLIDPARKKRSFAFPCGNCMIGDTNYVPIVHKMGLITYARAGGDSTSIITDFSRLDPLQVPSWHVWTGTTLDQMIAFAEKVKRAGGMGVYQIHGVGGEVFQISAATHRDFLAYLKAHESEYHVMTFSQAMETVMAR